MLAMKSSKLSAGAAAGVVVAAAAVEEVTLLTTHTGSAFLEIAAPAVTVAWLGRLDVAAAECTDSWRGLGSGWRCTRTAAGTIEGLGAVASFFGAIGAGCT